MSASEQKKRSTRAAQPLRQRKPAPLAGATALSGHSTPMLLAEDIERTLDLGDGFVVVKVRRHRSAASGQPGVSARLALLKTSFPDITESRLQIQLDRRAKDKLAPAGADANQEFMAQLDRDSMASRKRYLEQGLLLRSSDFLAPLGISRQALSNAVRDQRIFSIDGPSNVQLYPAFFVTSAQQRRRLEKISKALGDLPGPSKWQFFISPKVSLNGRTPVAALQDGDLAKVLTAANAFKER
ncbi:hypothetical protein GJ699_00780 [Duganella sp. FT80W]|uniref:DUF2384 domain-containing protein n=1 Tax=Duganella guangzhouensis TaxID=2666084 RepID=A0A6I2KSA7_9BURK|nr:hypothetical protein [Duganella guangzhouensis]MRW88513.1 hypothetical protein [Duganella guangzhouensis]